MTLTFAPTLSQFCSIKQILKQLKAIVFGKKVKCPVGGRQLYVVELEKNRL